MSPLQSSDTLNDLCLPPGLFRSHRVAEYAKSLLWERTKGRVVDPRGAEGISLSLRGELETLVDQVCRAWKNRRYLSFNLDDLVVGLDSGRGPGGRDGHLLSTFCGPYPGNGDGSLAFVDSPTVYIDSGGHVVAWYIPGAFAPRRSVGSLPPCWQRVPGIWLTVGYRYQAAVFDAVKRASDVPQSLLRVRTRPDNWRDNDQHFANPARCELHPGNAAFSIAWYNLGFGVRFICPVQYLMLNGDQAG